MIVTVLGSCANQTATRESQSILVEDRERNLNVLVDASPGIVAALGKSGRNAAEINDVILTHSHGDHILGFAYFVWQRHYERLGSEAAGDLRVHGLENVIELASGMLFGCYGETKFPFDVSFHKISPNSEFKIGESRIATCGTRHTTPSIGCTISAGDQKVAISSDTSKSDDFIVLAKQANLLLHEGMWTEAYREIADATLHSTANEAGLVARAAGVRQLALMHVYPQFLGRESELLREAAKVFDGPISVPHDGSVYLV